MAEQMSLDDMADSVARRILGYSAKARKAHPATSHAAAASVKNISEVQKVILLHLRYFQDLTDEELIASYRRSEKVNERIPKASDSGLRSRRAELVRLGKVKDSGQRRKTASGRKSIVWELSNVL